MTRAHPATLIEMLACRAETVPARAAFTFDGLAVPFGELWRRVNGFAARLLQDGLERGQPVLLALPNGAEFFTAFYGIQRAGGIAVPVFPGSGPERTLRLAAQCAARTLVVAADLPARLLAETRQLAAAQGVAVMHVDAAARPASRDRFPDVQPGDISFLQYTSGSTGAPKGVMLTHAGLMANIRQMIAGMAITPEDVFVSWLPVYHDMGLILKTMVPFYLAAATHLLPTNLRDVRQWLEVVVRRRATFTAGPDFAYRLLLRHVLPGEYDLSSLRVALNAAEPVRAETVRAFERTFGLANVMTAGYGLAEATVGVSMSAPGVPLLVDERGRVSVGRPFPGVELLIVRDGDPQPTGGIGEIMIRSQANALGYYNDPAATGRLFWREGFLHSGDLGCMDSQGRLFVVGRTKNIIKRSGETLAPQEIEEGVDALPGIRFSAALGVDRGGVEGEQVVVFAELRDDRAWDEEFLYELSLSVVECILARLGFRPARVCLLRPRSIPLTHNGKIQHGRLRELYLDGSLRSQGLIVYPPGPAGKAEPRP